MLEEIKNYVEKSNELRLQSSILLLYYTNPKSTAKEFHDQRNKVKQLVEEQYKCFKQIEYLLQ